MCVMCCGVLILKNQLVLFNSHARAHASRWPRERHVQRRVLPLRRRFSPDVDEVLDGRSLLLVLSLLCLNCLGVHSALSTGEGLSGSIAAMLGVVQAPYAATMRFAIGTFYAICGTLLYST